MPGATLQEASLALRMAIGKSSGQSSLWSTLAALPVLPLGLTGQAWHCAGTGGSKASLRASSGLLSPFLLHKPQQFPEPQSQKRYKPVICIVIEFHLKRVKFKATICFLETVFIRKQFIVPAFSVLALSVSLEKGLGADL